MKTPLSTTQKEQDKLFDEKFKTFEVEGDHSQFSEGVFVPDVETLKAYLKTRDLAIEEAVRAELVENVKSLGRPLTEDTNTYNHALIDVIDLLTTSPSQS